MKQYIGTKIVKAIPMNGEDAIGFAHKIGGYAPQSQGYEVEYEDGYKSWSPKSVFDAAYRETDGMPFGLAIEALKKGLKVARKGWNGKGMWLSLSHSEEKNIHASLFWSVNNQNFAAKLSDEKASVLPSVTMKTADNKILIGWLASQTDMLADDWQVVE